MEGIKRKFSEEKDLLDGKKIKKEQVPVFVEIQEAKGDSFCLPNTHLRINHNQNLDNLPFQCDICWKKFNFFASFALHAQMAHKEEMTNVVPELDFEIYCEICYETFDKFKDKVHHIDLKHYGNKGEFVHKNNMKTLLQKDSIVLNIVVKDNAPLAKGLIAARTVKKEIIDNKVKALGVEVMDNDENPNIVSCGRCKWAPKKKYDPVFRHVYNAHREDVSNGLKIRCLLCQNEEEVFMNTSAEFNKHMSQKHSSRYQKYRCSHCRFGTESARNLLCHKKFQHPSLPHYACDYCPTKFFNEETKNSHIGREHLDADSICQICSKVLKKESMGLHMSTAHKKSDPKTRRIQGYQMETETNPGIYACAVCPNFKPTAEIRGYKEHMRTAHHAMENNSKCGICQTVFDKLVMLRKHVRVDHKLQYANHRCPHCRFGCYINTDLESHKVQKHPDLKQYHCEVCNTGRVFFSESDYQAHLNKKHKKERSDETKYKCEHCFKEFSTLRKVKEHSKHFHGLSLKCEICGVTCLSKFEFDEHMINHGQKSRDEQKLEVYPSRYKDPSFNPGTIEVPVESSLEAQTETQRFRHCQIDGCEEKFESAVENVEHLLSNHHEKDKKCVFCDTVSIDFTKLMTHYYGVHLKIKSFSCKKCEMSFAKRFSAERHVKDGRCEKKPTTLDDIVENYKRPDSKKKPFCEPCQQGFLYQWSYNNHVRRVHEGIKDVQCSECGKCFGEQSHLNTHIRKVHAKKSLSVFNCEHCEKTYNTLSTLRTHMRTLHQLFVVWTPEEINEPDKEGKIITSKAVNAFQTKCPALDCEFECKSVEEWKDHSKDKHYGRPFQCEVCGKAFNEQFNLKKHFDGVHLGHKGHICEGCGQGFYKKSVMIRHQNATCSSVKPKLNHECERCGKEFDSHGKLNKHVEKIHPVPEEQKLSCTSCNLKFNRTKTYREHMVRIHDN